MKDYQFNMIMAVLWLNVLLNTGNAAFATVAMSISVGSALLALWHLVRK